MPSTSPSDRQQDPTLYEIAENLESMARSLKTLSDVRINRDIIYELRVLLAQAEQKFRTDG
jgi:hypothetical protein